MVAQYIFTLIPRATSIMLKLYEKMIYRQKWCSTLQTGEVLSWVVSAVASSLLLKERNFTFLLSPPIFILHHFSDLSSNQRRKLVKNVAFHCLFLFLTFFTFLIISVFPSVLQLQMIICLLGRIITGVLENFSLWSS